MSNAEVDEIVQGKIDEFDRLLVENVADDATRSALRHEYVNRATSPLSMLLVGLTLERDQLDADIREHTYRNAGIPEKAYELVADSFEGDHHDTEAVRVYGQEVGLVPPPEPKPGDPDYVWSSPAERRAYQEGQTNE